VRGTDLCRMTDGFPYYLPAILLQIRRREYGRKTWSRRGWRITILVIIMPLFTFLILL
jgi:hypothetical protein